MRDRDRICVMFAIAFVFSMLVSCAATQKTIIAPPSLRALERLTDHERAEAAKKEAPVAWAEGIRYLALAGDALDEGNENQADRFAKLGLIQINIALASEERAGARLRLEEATKKKYELIEDTSRIKDLVDKLEAENEREKMRRHLTRVVDETTRLSIAEGELGRREMTQREELDLSRLQFELGNQMVSRVRFWQEIIQFLSARGQLPSARTILVTGPVGLAEDALRKRDLISLQEHVELAGIEATRIVEQMWEGREREREKLESLVEKHLSEARIGFVREEIGIAVQVEVPKTKRGKRKKRKARKADHRLLQIAAFLRDHPSIAAFVVGTVGSAKLPKKATEDSEERTTSVAQELIQLGADKDRIGVHGCGATAPIRALYEGEDAVAVVLFPLSLKESR